MKKSPQVGITSTQPKAKEKARLKSGEPVAEAREELATAGIKAEEDPPTQTKRFSFVVRLTIDDKGQFGRTEIEDVSSGKKQNSRSLDGDRLVAFMKACINPESISEESISTKPR